MKINRNLIPVLILIEACSGSFHSDENSVQLPDSVLVAIRDGFDVRIEGLFDARKDIPLARWNSSGWNAPQRYAYPRIEYATTCFWLGQHMDSANLALVEYCEYFINDPGLVLHRDHFHWHSEMALRLIEMFGQNGTRSPGLMKPETEDKILEAVWLYSRRRQADQVESNTKAEADHKISGTWYIYESGNHHSQSFCTLWHFAKLIKDRPGFTSICISPAGGRSKSMEYPEEENQDCIRISVRGPQNTDICYLELVKGPVFRLYCSVP